MVTSLNKFKICSLQYRYIKDFSQDTFVTGGVEVLVDRWLLQLPVFSYCS